MADQQLTPEERQCGKDTNKLGLGRDAVARDRLWHSYRAGQPARFTTASFTIEGDPITYDIRVVAPGRIEVTIDSADKWGARGTFHRTCTTMERVLSPSPHSTIAGFLLSGCGANQEFIDGRGQLFIP